MRSPVLGLVAALAIPSGIAPAQAAELLQGRVSVIDGDTLEMHGQRIRLFGMDAPETGQPCTRPDGSPWRCGRDAAFALADLAQSHVVSCQLKDRDRYGRIVAVCRIGAIDLGRWVVEQGFAVAYRRYSLDYVSAEDDARRARRGFWAGSFEPPESWRHRKPSK